MKINENMLHKYYLFLGFFAIVILLLNCGYIGGAVAALLVPVYVAGHLYLNNKLKPILWKMMYVSNHGFKIVVLGFSGLSCYIGEPMFCALVFIVMPAYVTVHIFLNSKIELILWKLMYVSEHGYRIDPENFSRASTLRFVFEIPSRFQNGQVQRILKRLSRRISE